MLTEILDYTLKEGSADSFHTIMLNESIPLHKQAGIKVIWSGHNLLSADRYSLIRCFCSESEMENSLAEFYAGESWRMGPREKIVSLIVDCHRILLPGRFAPLDSL